MLTDFHWDEAKQSFSEKNSKSKFDPTFIVTTYQVLTGSRGGLFKNSDSHIRKTVSHRVKSRANKNLLPLLGKVGTF